MLSRNIRYNSSFKMQMDLYLVLYCTHCVEEGKQSGMRVPPQEHTQTNTAPREGI